jgi:hypothetical protein
MKWVVRIFGVLGGVALILMGALLRALLPTWAVTVHLTLQTLPIRIYYPHEGKTLVNS